MRTFRVWIYRYNKPYKKLWQTEHMAKAVEYAKSQHLPAGQVVVTDSAMSGQDRIVWGRGLVYAGYHGSRLMPSKELRPKS